MKKLMFFGLFLICVYNSIAQESEKNKTIFLGGEIDGQSRNYKFNNTLIFNPSIPITSNYSSSIRVISISASPYIGFKLNKSQSIGVIATGTLYREKTDVNFNGDGDINVRKRIMLGGGVFYRYTFQADNNLRFFLQPSIDFLKSLKIREELAFRNDYPSYTFNTRCNIGLSYRVSDTWNLVSNLLGVNFTYRKNALDDQIDTNREINKNFTLNSIINNLNLGFEKTF